MMKNTERDSSFELLRIIAMAFIVIWHISIHAQKGELVYHEYILATTITGVNIFILISGYFNINLKWKSLISILSTAIFFYIATLAAKCIVTGTTPTTIDIKKIFFPISYSPWWFISCYVQLMIISPLINVFLRNSDKKLHLYILGATLFLSCFSGFCLGNEINITGYNTFHYDIHSR